jgi:hypothetical protein
MKWVPHLHDGLIVVKVGIVRSTTVLLPQGTQKGCQALSSHKPLQINNIHLPYELYPTRYTEYRNQKQTNPNTAGNLSPL